MMTGFGSGYYHVDPNDRTLFWDRLPMAVGFMAILAIAIEDRLDTKAGAFLLWPLIAIGVISLLLWRWTGDLRLYGWVQFFPCVAVPVLFLSTRQNSAERRIGSLRQRSMRLQSCSSTTMQQSIPSVHF
jgi:hypothetical protein